MSKVDPSFKSKRYRDKLRTEIKGLECLIPVDRSVLHRKLDSQTVFRLIISYFRLKILFQSPELHQAIPETGDNSQDIPKDFFDGQSINQIMDGFLLVATTDGTVLYTTENVLQYIGFNQVDLMHRCMYGLVHPDDHYDLKATLESSTHAQEGQDHIGCLRDLPKTRKDKYVSFVCRMKCFNGSAAGYLKMYCSGKIESFSNFPIKNNNGAVNVIMLYCQPFMLTGSGSDVSNEVKQNVFWSKHNMDLKIREFDKKSEDIIGYEASEMNDRSMYTMVHPEDLAAFSACHKNLIDSTDVRTMYFRIICKDGRPMWLHSRGKVVSKNSKKFSIVFTHCPVREEDSTFLQQESVARRRYAVHDLICFQQFGHYTSKYSSCDTDSTKDHTSQVCSPCMGFTEDMSLSFYSAPTTCPSSWHAVSDRHSPVLPSTHVAHKISQKEKQLQFQEFRRRQQVQMQYITQPNPYSSASSKNLGCSFHQSSQNDQTAIQPDKDRNVCFVPEKQIKIEPCVDNYESQFVPSIQSSVFNDYKSATCGHFPTFHPCYHRPLHGTMLTSVAGTVTSPQKLNHYTFPIQQNFSPEYGQSNMMSYHGLPLSHESYRHGGGLHFVRQDPSNVNVFPYSPHISEGSGPSQCIRTLIKPQANIKLSMHCDYTHPNLGQQFQIPVETRYRPLQEAFTRPRSQSEISIDGKSCAVNTGQCPPEEVIQYDIEASIHMKIVDNSGSKYREPTKTDPDLPSIGSFLEYLNDS